jgi:hypothetical protein
MSDSYWFKVFMEDSPINISRMVDFFVNKGVEYNLERGYHRQIEFDRIKKIIPLKESIKEMNNKGGSIEFKAKSKQDGFSFLLSYNKDTNRAALLLDEVQLKYENADRTREFIRDFRKFVQANYPVKKIEEDSESETQYVFKEPEE